MKHQKKHSEVKLGICFIGLFALMFVSVMSIAQTEVEPDSEPTAATEITCFAALKKWVCAPSDQKQLAHEKAMRLAEQQANDNTIQDETNPSDSVAIKTLENSDDFSQQVQELPLDADNQQSMIDEQTSEFKPVQDSQMTTEPIEEFVPSEDSENENPIPVKQTPTSTASNVSTGFNDFSEWQNNYPDQWTFQVVGTSNHHHLDQFIIDNGLTAISHSQVKTQVNGADWWIVVVGLYNSREQALNQRDELPGELANQAWVRQVKTINSELE